ncbi:hypothetical protein [Muricoccus radiodurans]|uniref:hypothetical protein n=1 Tax=Muricoccus radiodurans TaxID=2231721 RepID=UPI003CF6DC35
MNFISDPCPAKAGEAAPRTDDVFWQHRAFCGLALPLRATRETWQREIGATMVRMEPGEGLQVPSGRFLRLVLMQICDVAFRTKSPVVDLGESPSAWAVRLGLELDAPALRDLATQLDRLLSGRVAVSVSGPELFMFDARGRRPQGDAGWRPSIRLNSRFLSSLLASAVPLNRGAVLRLWDMPEALDAYAWMAQAGRSDSDASYAEGWADIQQRFGRGSQPVAAFRSGFEEALQAAVAAAPSWAATSTEAGVSIRREEGSGTIQDDAAAADRRDEPVVPTSDHPATPVSDAEAEVGPGLGDHATLKLPVADEPTGQEPVEAPTPGVAPRSAAEQAELTPPPEDRSTLISQDQVSLPHHLTGLPVVIWLRRGRGDENIVIGATPGTRFDPDRLTVLAVEPMLLQVSGGLAQRDFEQVSAWVMANRDLIDDFWDGLVTTFEDLRVRTQKPRAPGWR